MYWKGDVKRHFLIWSGRSMSPICEEGVLIPKTNCENRYSPSKSHILLIAVLKIKICNFLFQLIYIYCLSVLDNCVKSISNWKIMRLESNGLYFIFELIIDIKSVVYGKCICWILYLSTAFQSHILKYSWFISLLSSLCNIFRYLCWGEKKIISYY